MHLPRILRTPLAGLLRSLPVRGRWRIAPLLNRLFPVERVEVPLSPVGRIALDLADEDQLQIFWTGLHADDVRIIALMRWALPADGVFVDIGANIGIHTLAAARHVAAGGGAVVAFEPHPHNYQTLQHNVARNELHHVVTHNVGLAETPDVLTCHGDPQGGNWSLGSRGNFTFDVRLLRLDDHLQDHPLPRIDMMKIDVEGAEVRVLQGARQTIARYRPAIVFEVCPAWLRRLNATSSELLATVEGMGYIVHRLSDEGAIDTTSRVSAGDLNNMSMADWTNLVALPAPRRARPSAPAERSEKVRV